MIKHLLISIFCLTFAAAQTNITGSWQSDWQNSPAVCSPDSFNITQTVVNATTTNTSIDYYFSSDTIVHNCAGTPITGNYSSTLTLTQSSNTWQDQNGQQIIYNQVTDTIVYPLSSTTVQNMNLYDRNGTFIANGKVGSILGGTYTNPVAISGTGNCPCIPYQINAYPLSFSSFNASATLYYNSSTCTQTQDSYSASLYQPDPQNITWRENSTSTQPSFSLNTNIVAPQLTLTINPLNSTCVFSYTKTQAGLLSGQWSLDWQTQNMGYPISVQVATFQSSYMKTIFHYKNQTNQNDYFALTGDAGNPYAAFVTQQDFYYNATLNTFIEKVTVNGAPYEEFYTPNGSYISQDGFIQTWDNPTTDFGEAISPSDCCYPYSIVITADPGNSSFLSATYNYSSEVLSSEWCTDISPNVPSNTNQIQATLSVPQPSFVQLVWKDEFGYTISLLNPQSWSNISVTYESQLGDQCSFELQSNSTSPPDPNPPKPIPDGAIWLSSGVAYLMVILMAYL